MTRHYVARLLGYPIAPDARGALPKPLQTFHPSLESARGWGKGVMAGEVPEGAYVSVSVVKEETIEEIRK